MQVVTTLLGYGHVNCAISYNLGEQLFLYSVTGANCIIRGAEVIDEQDSHFAALQKSRLIGQTEYLTTAKRQVLYRDNNNKHQILGEGQAYQNYKTYDRPLKEEDRPDVIAMITEDGFSDVDGFNENHIYAAGGKGDVWRYVDGIWIECAFPTNMVLENVCCGKDGLVYISGIEGMTYVGIEDNWKALKNPELSLMFKSMAWYDGKVWATNDYGTWWVTPSGIVKANIPNSAKVCSGRLHVNADMLLLVGLGGAALIEDNE